MNQSDSCMPEDMHRIRRQDRHECALRRKNLPAYQVYIAGLQGDGNHLQVDSKNIEMNELLSNLTQKVS